MSDCLRSHGLQHARPPCPSPTPRAYSNSRPLSWWCHPTISSSVVPFSSCPQTFPASGSWTSLVAQLVKNLPAMWETWVQSLGQEDPLAKGMATHSSILAWRIPWTEEPGVAKSRGCKELGTTSEQLSTHTQSGWGSGGTRRPQSRAGPPSWKTLHLQGEDARAPLAWEVTATGSTTGHPPWRDCGKDQKGPGMQSDFDSSTSVSLPVKGGGNSVHFAEPTARGGRWYVLCPKQGSTPAVRLTPSASHSWAAGTTSHLPPEPHYPGCRPLPRTVGKGGPRKEQDEKREQAEWEAAGLLPQSPSEPRRIAATSCLPTAPSSSPKELGLGDPLQGQGICLFSSW